ncbi:MAG: GNAT family N-acetyltransferase [Acidiferrobacterales bacterium]
MNWDAAETASRRVRHEVFVVEQGIAPELEWDGRDSVCIHVIATTSPELPIGTVRMQPDGHIGRMAVLQPWRGSGVGGALIEFLIPVARELGLTEVWLTAQAQAIGFYQAHGFLLVGAEFLEAGIAHHKMIRAL